MKLVVDTNIIFSALLKKESKELDLLLRANYEFFIPKTLFVELFKHKEKIIQASKLEEDEILELLYSILEKLEVVDDRNICPAPQYQLASHASRFILYALRFTPHTLHP